VSCAIIVFPFVWMVGTAFKAPVDVVSLPVRILPEHPTLENFRYVLTKWPIVRFLLNSLFISAFCTFCILFGSSAAGYVYAKIAFKGRAVVFAIMLSTAILPIESYIILLYVMIAKIGWVNTYQGIIAPMVIMGFGIFFLRQNIYAIPDELLDAARLDGASELNIYLRIILPLTRSAMATFAVYAFPVVWGQFLWPLLVVNSQKLFTTELGLAMFQKREIIEYGLITAATTCVTIPVLIAYLFFRKQIVRTTVLSGLKS